MKFLFFLFLVLTLPLHSQSQDCKYEKKEIGNSTGNKVIITIPIIIYELEEVEGNISFKIELGLKLINSDTLVRLRIFRNNDRQPFSPEDNLVTFLLKDESIITLKAKEVTECKSYVKDKSVITMYDFDYTVNSLILNNLASNKLVRININWSSVVTENIIIQLKKQNVVKSLIPCL